MTVRTWTCKRQNRGVKCGAINPRTRQICQLCGKRRPKTKASPRDVPDVPYETCVELFGERCGICGRPPKPGKVLNRDHDHATGELRGLLCFQDNFRLRRYATFQWVKLAVAYLARHEERMGRTSR